MGIRFLLTSIILLWMHPFTGYSSTGQRPDGPPDIVLIVSDDHGTDALGCYGNKVIQTPHLDMLASDGVLFTNAFCTSASCSPSRSVILTGLHGHANGMYGLEHSIHHQQSFDHAKSLPVFLSEAGYRTARVGKFHVAPEEVYRFDEVLSRGEANQVITIGRSPVEMALKCEDFIRTEDPRPFFLFFATDDPHRGVMSSKGDEVSFDAGLNPNNFGNRPEGYPGVSTVTYDPGEVIVPSFLPDTKECRQELAQYYQSVSRLDQGIGKLFEILKKSGKYKNTLIIYISDNGIAFPGAKTTLYEPGMHLPCIIKNPFGNRAGTEEEALVSWTDITPTILDYANVTAGDNNFHGRSFKLLVKEGKTDAWNSEVYASHCFHEITMYYPMRVCRTSEYKLIWNIAFGLRFPMAQDLYESATWKGIQEQGSVRYGQRSLEDFFTRPEFELYDLVNDPAETANLSGDPGYAGILEDMKRKIREFQKRTSDPWQYKWNYK